MSFKYGKKPATYDKRDIKYADIRPKGLVVNSPSSYGRGMDFHNGPPPGGWGMMGNGPVDDSSLPSDWAAAKEGAGDCTIADPAHVERMNAHDAKRPIPSFSTKTVLAQYIYLTGETGTAYSPITGNNDNGLNIRDVLNYRRQQGLYDDHGNHYKIGVYVSLEPGNWEMLREACWLFPGISIGIEVPQSAEDQFSMGQIWSVTPGMTNNIVGGHDVPLVGHYADHYVFITWATRTVMTYEFLTATCDEMYAYVDLERINQVTGETYNNYKEVDLEKYITMVAN